MLLLIVYIYKPDGGDYYILVSPDGKQRPRLPVLVANEKTKLFDTNVMVTYLLELAGIPHPSANLLNLLNFEAHSLFVSDSRYFTFISKIMLI